MKPSSWDKQRGVVLPRWNLRPRQRNQTNPSKNVAGLDASHHTHAFAKGGKEFFLDILFHRTTYKTQVAS
jgi:hypothetical protein